MLKAVAVALREFSNFNATLDVSTGEIILKKYYHIGVAVQSDDGLIVPVVRDVDRKSIMELAVELVDLVERTRSRKITIDEMRGGSFTITNIGAMGGGHFNPIINYPEVAILGTGKARWQPVVQFDGNGKPDVIPRFIMPVSLTIDHRVLDGANAIEFITVLKSVLEDPDELLMLMV